MTEFLLYGLVHVVFPLNHFESLNINNTYIYIYIFQKIKNFLVHSFSISTFNIFQKDC